MSDQTTTLTELKSLVAEFIAQRRWQQFHDPKNLTMSIAIEAAELMEHFQWARTDELEDLLRDAKLRTEVTDELADVLAFVLSLANVLHVDLSDALRRKMAQNAQKYPADQFKGRYK